MPKPTLKLTFITAQPNGRKTQTVVEIPFSGEVRLNDLRKAWEFEQFVNSTISGPVRLHVEIEDDMLAPSPTSITTQKP